MDAADVVKQVRRSNGLSVRALASVAGVSPATVDRIEHRRVEPLRSVDQILDALGCKLVMRVERASEPQLTRADRRSLAFHRLIAMRVLEDPAAVRAKARHNLEVMRGANRDGSANSYFDRWDELLDGDDADLVATLLDPRSEARDLRQVTPFAGVLTPKERATVYPRRGQHAT